MVTQPDSPLTPAQYLSAERQAESKNEYWRGEVFAMAGASEAQNLIVANILASLVSQFRGRPCKVYPSDLRVKVSRSGLYTYPDVTAVCGKPEFEDEYDDTLLNPTVVFEVLSPSTEAYDRGQKFEHYQMLASLTDYLLVSQDHRVVFHYVRQSEGRWLLTIHMGSEAIAIIESIHCELAVVDVYDKLDLSDDDLYSMAISMHREQNPDWNPHPGGPIY